MLLNEGYLNDKDIKYQNNKLLKECCKKRKIIKDIEIYYDSKGHASLVILRKKYEGSSDNLKITPEQQAKEDRINYIIQQIPNP